MKTHCCCSSQLGAQIVNGAYKTFDERCHILYCIVHMVTFTFKGNEEQVKHTLQFQIKGHS